VFSQGNENTAVVARHYVTWVPALVVSFFVCGSLVPLEAQEEAQEDESPAVTLGAGMQTSFLHHQPAVGDSVDNFRLNSLRFYVNGQAADNIGFMINT
ncbi:uncharacterized protein METZ01_LOCUS247447, partial [marine metagenome]